MDFKPQLAKDARTVENAAKLCKRPVLEPKYDGWRGVVFVTESGARVFNRSKKEYTGKLPELETELAKFPAGTVLDGEIVCMQLDPETGRWVNDFFRIHTCMRSNETLPSQRKGIQFVAFDLIEYPDRDPDVPVWAYSLEDRQTELRQLVEAAGAEGVSVTMQLKVSQENHDALVELGFEGTVVKDLDKPYAKDKRGHGFFKVKATTTLDMVVLELPKNGKGQHTGKVGHVVLGQYKDGELVRRCTCNPLDHATRDEMTHNPEKYLGRVAEIKIYGVHPETGAPRHPTFYRWRYDKDPQDCVWSNE